MKIFALICLTSLALSAALVTAVPAVPVDRARKVRQLQPFPYPLQAAIENPDIVYLNPLQQKPNAKGPAYITRDGLVYVAPQPGYVDSIYNWLNGPSPVHIQPAPGSQSSASPQPKTLSAESQRPSGSQPTSSQSPSSFSLGEEQPNGSKQETLSVKANPDSNGAETGQPIVAAEASPASKLELLEPEAESVTEVPQKQQPTTPQPQLPLLPGGQTFYIPQQPQLYGNIPQYAPLPNYSPDYNLPGGYQRFYIINSQPVYDVNYAGVQGIQGIQNSAFLDPNSQVENLPGVSGLGLETFGGGPYNGAAVASDPITTFGSAFPIASQTLTSVGVPPALPFYEQPAQFQFSQDFPVQQSGTPGAIQFSQYVNLQQQLEHQRYQQLPIFQQLHAASLNHPIQLKGDSYNPKKEKGDLKSDNEKKIRDTETTTLKNSSSETSSEIKPTDAFSESH